MRTQRWVAYALTFEVGVPSMVAARKRVLVGAVSTALVLVAAFGVLMNLNSPATGRLRHDESLRTTTVDEVWRVQKPRYDRCLVIRFTAEVSGNAKSTWGMTGPTTVWENLRVHDTRAGVEVRTLSDGRCGERVKVGRLVIGQQWKTGDGDRRRGRRTHAAFTGTARATNNINGLAVRLDGGSYDRGEAYRTTLGIYVEPNWKRGGGYVTDGAHVERTVELTAG